MANDDEGDKMFDESHMLQQATPSSILSYVRLKGFWPTSPKDMAVLNTTFITKDAIHYFATSVDDTTQYPSIPPPVSPFVRSELVVSGWYLEAIKPRSVRVVYIAQAPPTGWMVPGSALGAMTTEMPLCVAEIIKYLETYGSPPTLVSIRRGRALGVDYSHEKSTFRLEYVQDSNPIFSGHRVLLQQQQQQQQVQAGDRYRRSTVDYTAGVTGSGEHQSVNSPKLGPTDKLLAEIRLDARTWARNGDSEITIDPPPSKVTCSCVPHDGTGYRLRIEHSSGRAVPAGGKVLLIARKSVKPGCGIVVNGLAIKMPSMEHLESWMPHKTPEMEKDKALTMSMVDGALAEKEGEDENEEDSSRTKLKSGHVGSAAGEDEATLARVSPTGSPDRKRSPEGLQTPLQYAQSAMNLLSRIRSEPEDSWSVVSDSKGGLRVTKRFMPTEISDQAITPNALSSTDGPSANSAASSSPAQARPKAHLHLSAWILERIDPYSTSHPIPSTRVTYMTALDLGGSVPQRVSGMIQTMFPRMITHVETYLQVHAAPPIVRIPEQMVIGPSSDTNTEFMDEEQEKPLPSILPWTVPANRMISSEFKLKDSFCEVVLLFDQFRLSPSRLDLAAQRRARKHKKNRQKSREGKDRERDHAEADEAESDSTSSQEKTHNRTVLEMVVDLKQYPIGYNIMTNIKVDPEFLLQQKQQRDSVMKQSMMASSTSSIKRSGSALLQVGSTANSSTSKFIGGFESSGSGSVMDSGGRPSVDGEVGHTPSGSKSSSSEAASSGTGIAAVLGGAANLSRPLPSSTSLIRILPPPLTVQVIDIPPAPSHSSSLSGVSKRRKHLIIVTVPEAESSQAYAQAQQQQAAAVAQQSLKSAAPLVVSGTTAKPVMTASTVSGSTSMNFAAGDRSESSRSRPQGSSSSSSSQDADFASSEVDRPAFSPNTIVPSETQASPKATLLASVTKPALAMETRMFQFGVKIDRLEHAAAQATKETLGNLAEEMEWLGRVMVDGVPVKVMTGISRQELGFTDGMMEDDEDGAELQRGRSPQQNGDVYSDKEIHDLNTDHGDDDGGHGQGSDDGEPTLRSTSGSRKRKHHRQQLAQLNKQQDSGLGAEGREETTSRNNGPGSPSTAEAGLNQRPTSSMSGFSAFLMNVGLLSQRGSRADLDAVAENAHDGDDDHRSRDSSAQSQGQSRSSLDYEDLDDDRTIRASKSVSRNRISDAMNTRSNSGKQKTRNGGPKHSKADLEHEHDLDLESLHGSIVFQSHHHGGDDDLYNGASGTDALRSEIDVEYDESRTDRDVLDWARESGTIRRRKGKEATVHDEGSAASGERSGHGERSSMDAEIRLPSSQAQKHRRQGSRSSLLARHRSRGSPSQSKVQRPGSTNGADHPRFRGSLLYAYTFRNLFWCAIACFLLGLLLRIYVIGPSFLKTASRASGGPNGSGYTTTYYYYRAAPRRPDTGTFISPASKILSPLTGKWGSRDTTASRERDQDSQHQHQHQQESEDRTSSAEAELEGSVWPQGIREVFTVRRILGWDFVLLAYPAQEQQQQQQ
ncbi:hypothetical protein BGZ70_010158 [Mortierella alpina]|uniref:START domain-containing protein n=1 Tax=Mortierella alpina TaxID=64518 RepID=A0A9P6IZR2_MORAP|nr:hypothetical protein BGZ70_010158 [Mortierella alpina]